MAYPLKIPQDQMRDLWRLKEFCAEGPIIGQVRMAVGQYLKQKEAEFGCSLSDIQEARERHERESEE